jgi:hypothetical protein
MTLYLPTHPCPHCGEIAVASDRRKYISSARPVTCHKCGGLSYNLPPGFAALDGPLDLLTIVVVALAMFLPRVLTFPAIILVVLFAVRSALDSRRPRPTRFFAVSPAGSRRARWLTVTGLVIALAAIVTAGALISSIR